jgi:phosphoenolpyruvate synthase/pyruvate phosphate dikinase
MIDLENLSLTELKQLKCEINKIESKKKALNRENIDYENLPEMKPIIGFENLYSITKELTDWLQKHIYQTQLVINKLITLTIREMITE